MLTLLVFVLLAAMSLALVRAVRGPTVYDRILAANAFSTKTIVMVAVFGFMVGQPDLYLDIALMYSLIGFIATVAVLKMAEFGNLGAAGSDTQSRLK
jgi:multicomponent Na+:H+ antiporter subunit F